MIGSTFGLLSSAGSGSAAPAVVARISDGGILPMFHPHGNRRCQLRPCERNDGQKVPNWNHRTCSSPVYSAVGTKPPMSVPQNGMPDRPVFTATGTCVFNVSQVV